MNQVPVKLGPLALLLSVISICLTTLSILAFTTAQADVRLAEKFAETVRVRYELEIRGQEFLRDLRENGAPAGKPDEDGIRWTTFEQDGAILRVGIAEDGSVAAWRQEKEWNQDTGIGNLWAGF